MRKALLILAMASSAVMFGKPLSPEEALEAAMGSGKQNSLSLGGPSSYSLSWQSANQGVYVFSRDAGGFIVAAGDSECPPLLGYSDISAFDSQTIPPALEAFITAIDSAIKDGQAYRLVRTRSGKTDISPLVSAKWNQSGPYNNLCPELQGKHCLTGCAATAMAQVIKYWEYPTNPIGEISYTWPTGGETLTYDFSKVTFDWHNMLDVYDDNAAANQDEAVAQLMLACGMASQMDYTHVFSGTTDIEAGLGMINHFAYDRSLKLLFRDFYRIGEWNDMVYNELSAGHPILYYGFSPVGGHAFVCDGYDGNDGDYFHINWGWGGLSDGYFLINGLNPEYIGLGGSTGGFNIMQSAFFGLEPAEETQGEMFQQVLCFGYFATEKSSYTKGNRILFGIAGGIKRTGFYNMSLENIYFTPGLKLTPANGGEPFYFPATKGATVKPAECMDTFSVDTSDFPEGTFRVTPTYKLGEDDIWHEMPEETQMHTKMLMTISGSDISINTTDDSDGIIVNDFRVSPAVFKCDEPVGITLNYVSHNLDERITLTPTLITAAGYIVAQGEAKVIDAFSGEGGQLSWSSVFEPAPEPGSYLLGLLNPKTQLVTDPISVVVTGENVENEFKLSNVRFNRTLANTESNRINGETLSVSCKLELISGYFEGEATAWILDSSDSPISPLAEAKSVVLGPGASQSLSFKGSVAELNPDAAYGIGIILTDLEGVESQVGDVYPFTAPDASEVESVIMDSDSQEKIFTLQGIRVSKPEPGDVVIRVSEGKATKMIVQ